MFQVTKEEGKKKSNPVVGIVAGIFPLSLFLL
jgi:hypothetical protein